VSVIIGLAAQGTLGNIIAGIALLMYRPFRLGDRVRYVRQILSDLAKSQPKVLALAGAPVTKLSAQGMTLYVSGWCANSEDAQQVEFDLYAEARKRFDQEKIGVH
jgi:small-conductance mechanosensitive channel